MKNEIKNRHRFRLRFSHNGTQTDWQKRKNPSPEIRFSVHLSSYILFLLLLSMRLYYVPPTFCSNFVFGVRLYPLHNFNFFSQKKHKAIGVGFLNIVSRSQESSTVPGFSKKSLIENWRNIDPKSDVVGALFSMSILDVFVSVLFLFYPRCCSCEDSVFDA